VLVGVGGRIAYCEGPLLGTLGLLVASSLGLCSLVEGVISFEDGENDDVASEGTFPGRNQ
jgi:hypothetical protein